MTAQQIIFAGWGNRGIACVHALPPQSSRPQPDRFMNEWLRDAPALLYVNNTWLVVNKWCELLSWTEDANEAAWIVRSVLEHEEIRKRQEDKATVKLLRGRKPKPPVVVMSASTTPEPNSAQQKIAVVNRSL
jgi:hypothetical protein